MSLRFCSSFGKCSRVFSPVRWNLSPALRFYSDEGRGKGKGKVGVKEDYEITKLLIENYRMAYDTGAPLVADVEYDSLYQSLLDIEKKNPSWCNHSSPSQQVAPQVGSDTKRLHSLPMLGLNNTYNDDQLEKFNARVIREIGSREVRELPIEYVTEMKYDGMAVSLIFKNGTLCYAATRGDGLFGEDITSNFLQHVHNLPLSSCGSLTVPHKEDIVEIRGEIICNKKEFKRANKQRKKDGAKEFSTPRNLATGCLSKLLPDDQSKDISLDMICYSLHIYKENRMGENTNLDMDQLEQSVQWSPFQPQTQWECLSLLSSWQFPVCPRAARYEDFSDTLTFLHKYEKEEEQDLFHYITDGVAIKVNAMAQQLALGRIARSYRWAVAYKFPTEIYATKLLDVQFQIGRSGKATPVAHLEKILIDGSNVSRATLHNINFMEQHNIEIGDIVKVEKSGGTIPKISGLANPLCKETVASGSSLTLICPCSKQSPLVKREGYVDVFCSNQECTVQNLKTIQHFAHSLSIIGLGEAVLKQLIEANLVHKPSDIFLLHKKTVEMQELPRWGEKKVNNLIQNIEEAKSKATLAKILFALAIPNVGLTICKQLSKKYQKLQILREITQPQLEADGFTHSASTQLSYFLQDPAKQEILDVVSSVLASKQ